MASFHLLPTLYQQSVFLLSTDQRCESSWLSHLKATGGTTLPEHVVELSGLGNATQGVCSQVLTREIALHQTIGRITDGNGIGLRQALDSGGDIWCLPQG